MNRKHLVEDYIKVYEKLKEINSLIRFSSDFIIGYPGETHEDFEKTFDIVQRIKFINSYSFIFSPRPGTVAANLEVKDKKISLERLEKLQKELETLSQPEIAQMQKDIQEKGKDLEFLAGKIQQAQEETAQKVFADTGPAMQKIIGELITAKQIKVLLAKNETMLFSDPALDLTDDVTSMLDVAASEASSQSD